ncbi:MAG: nucleotidyl transferase AbiEii/AbiGii toxin family protein [Acidobacteria bacterium]|nr:nucleotidyl transferase AbiEii/AbiGii toxin family protein [Acidobacteriota bacterium]
MFLDTLDPPARVVFQQLGREPFLSAFFLAGGSALALHLGHRISIDLDFFSQREYSMLELLGHLQSLGRLSIATQDSDTLVGELNGVKLSFFTYPYPLLEDVVMCEGIQLASLLDIALMKVAAIAQRGKKRDFVDLFFLCQERLTLDNLLRDMPRKFPNLEYPSYHLLRALAYFDDAEVDEMPKMLKPVEWAAVRGFFSGEVNRLMTRL